MDQNLRVIPAPVAALLSRLPVYPGSLLFVSALNLALPRHLPDDVRQSLRGKRLRIRVTDAQLSFDFQWRHDRFAACQTGADADLTISAHAHDFLLLARRLEDPDSLFFSRRLVMEGDTELGLLMKNTMDAIEQPMLNLAQLSPLHRLSQLKTRLRG